MLGFSMRLLFVPFASVSLFSNAFRSFGDISGTICTKTGQAFRNHFQHVSNVKDFLVDKFPL